MGCKILLDQIKWPFSFKLSNFSQNFPTAAKLWNFKRSFSTSLGSFQLGSVLSNFNRIIPTSLDSFQLQTFQLKTSKLLVLFNCSFHYTHPDFLGENLEFGLDFVSRNDSGCHPRCNFFLNYQKLLRIDTHGFCFRKWRSMTLPNDLGFCFRKWRSVTHPGFWEYFTLTLNIFFWWRHTSDVTSCMYTLTSTLTATYDVTAQL